MRHTPYAAILFFVLLCGGPAKAEFEFGAYLGGNPPEAVHCEDRTPVEPGRSTAA